MGENVLLGKKETGIRILALPLAALWSVRQFHFSETEFPSQQREGLDGMISQVHLRFEILFLRVLGQMPGLDTSI